MNRRKFTRQPVHLSALVHPERGRSWLCTIRDFCAEGILLTGGAGSRSLVATGADVVAGEEIALHFSVATPAGQSHFRTRARVARVLDDGNGLGVSFPEGLEEDAFAALMDFAIASGTAVPEVTSRAGTPLEVESSELTAKQITGAAAQSIKARVEAVTKRAVSRLATAFLGAAGEDFLIKARDAGTNAIQEKAGTVASRISQSASRR